MLAISQESQLLPDFSGSAEVNARLIVVAGGFQDLEGAAISWPSVEGQPRHRVRFALPSQTHEHVGESACRSALLVERYRRGQGNDGAFGLVEPHPQVAQEFEGYRMGIEIHRALHGFRGGRQIARGNLLLGLVDQPRRGGPREFVRLKQIFVAQPILLRSGV